jgi:hypothetical protein
VASKAPDKAPALPGARYRGQVARPDAWGRVTAAAPSPDQRWYGIEQQFSLLRSRIENGASWVSRMTPAERRELWADYGAGRVEARDSDLPFAYGLELVKQSTHAQKQHVRLDVDALVHALEAFAQQLPSERTAFELERVLLAAMGSIRSARTFEVLARGLRATNVLSLLDWQRPSTLELGKRLAKALDDRIWEGTLETALVQAREDERAVEISTGFGTSVFVYAAQKLQWRFQFYAAVRTLRALPLSPEVARALNGHVFELMPVGTAPEDGTFSRDFGMGELAATEPTRFGSTGRTTPFVDLPGAPFAEQVSAVVEDGEDAWDLERRPAFSREKNASKQRRTQPSMDWTLGHALGLAVMQRHLATLPANTAPATLLPLPDVVANSIASGTVRTAAEALTEWLRLEPQLDPVTGMPTSDAAEWFANVTAEYYRDDWGAGYRWLEQRMPDVLPFFTALYGPPPREWELGPMRNLPSIEGMAPPE